MYKSIFGLIAALMLSVGSANAAVISDNGLEVEVTFTGASAVNGDTLFCYDVTDLGTPDLSNISFLFDCPPDELVLLDVTLDGSSTSYDLFGPGDDNPQVPNELEPADGYSVKLDVGTDFEGEICFLFEGEIGVEEDSLVVFGKGGQEGASVTLDGPECGPGGGGEPVIPTPTAAAMGLMLMGPMLLRRKAH